VFVIDWTTTGWGDPTETPPMMAETVGLRALKVTGYLRELLMKANSG